MTDAGVETDLIFNHGIKIRESASHTLLPNPRAVLRSLAILKGSLPWRAR